MATIEEIFKRIRESSILRHNIKSTYKELLDSNQEYVQLVEKVNALKLRKKQIEKLMEEQMMEEFKQHDIHGRNIAGDKEMLTHMTLKEIVAGNPVSIKDEKQQELVPFFSVVFRKARS